MNRPLRKAETVKAKPLPKPVTVDPKPFPDLYATRVAGNCMEPLIKDGSVVMIDKKLPCARGDLVVIYLRPEFVRAGGFGVLLKRMVFNMIPGIKYPFKQHPDSNVMPVLIVEQLNPPRQFQIGCDQVQALYRCTGPVPAGTKLIEGEKGGAK